MNTPSRQRVRFALVGMPNTGKSTLFNRLTGVQAKVANWPGMTVDLLSARVILGGRTVELVDLPGLYSLHGFGEDERLVRHFLEQEQVTGLLAVVNAVQLERQLPLVLQLQALGRPLVVVLNMADEARRLGVRIDAARLQQKLSAPVLLVDAKHGNGIAPLRQALQQLVATAPASAATAQMLPAAEAERLRADDRYEAQAAALAAATVDLPHVLPARLTDRIDRVLLHPVAGVPLFFGVMLLLFELVYGIGLPLQDGLRWLIDAAKQAWLGPWLAAASPAVRSFVLEGLVDGVGTVLTFLPVILVFFVAMALVEDSGYLVRIAFLMDRWMARLGLDGRAFVMQLMGMGCNVPAIMGTRVLRSRGSRLLAMLAIPFSLCSARLQVLVFVAAAFFSRQAAPLVLASLYAVSFIVAFATALIWRRRFAGDEPLLLEMPPYRLPTLRALFAQGWQSSRHFLENAGGFIVAGVLLIWWLTHYPFDAVPASPQTLAGQLAALASPVFAPIGIDSILSIALIFGFVAKEIVLGGLAVIYGAGQDELGQLLASRLTWQQAASFMLFTLVYTPCLSTVATIWRESRSAAFTLLSVVWPLAVAWLLSFAFYSVASRLFA
ncbi:MAG: ferrous iron transport protein B [Burkholderiales bacterium]|nr:ferrous iron transport protein B [Burkholderiales bacterium]